MARAAASWIAIVLFAVSGAARGLDGPSLRVRVALEFDGPAPSVTLTRALRSETAARWERYRVALAWSHANACDPADLSIAVVVRRIEAASDTFAPRLILGMTRIDDGIISGPIVISEPAIRATLAARSPEHRSEVASFPGGAEAELGRAVGRVLAHELGHVLLAAPYHRPAGLMRALFPADELGGVNPGPFTLADMDVARLRNRLPVILAGRTARRGDC